MKKQNLIAIPALLASASSIAAVDAAVTTAITDAGTDAVTVVSALVVASVAVLGIMWVKRMVSRGGGA